MATGLQFDPFGNLGFSNPTGYNIPAVADDYTKQNVWQLPALPNLKPQPNSPLVNAWRDINEWNAMSDEEKEKANKMLDPMYGINRWERGLWGLDADEKSLWEQENQEKIDGKTEAWRDRLWRNQQFANTFGDDLFYNIPNAKDRDKIFSEYITNDAIKRKYEGNPNIEQLLSLTQEGKRELLNSDYKSAAQLKEADEKEDDRAWTDYSLRERWDAIDKIGGSQGMIGLGLGASTGNGPLAVIAGISGLLAGTISAVVNPGEAADLFKTRRKTENDEILDKIQVADNERKKEESKDDINTLTLNYYNALREGHISAEEVDRMFDDIALNQKKTTLNELGQSDTFNYTGSNYYSAFKDSDEFAKFDTYDKLRYIAQSQVLSQKYGHSSAISILDQDMQNYVSDNQSGLDWARNTAKNMFVGGVANLGMAASGLGALFAENFYGEEGLNNYLNGKDASGDGTDNWINPQYWNKVDQYNTFGWDNWYNPFSYNPEIMRRMDENGGVSQYNNVTRAGEEGNFLSWNTTNEALRMVKFTWSQILQNYIMRGGLKGAVRMTGGIETAPGILATESSALSKGINYAGGWATIGGSSLGIDAAYGMQTYEEVLRENNQRLDQMIEKDVEEIVKERLNTSQYQQEFRQYVDAENKRRKQRAGEKNPYIGVDEEKAWQDYVEHVTNQVRKEQEERHKEDREQAALDAANAYAIDATIEGLRMTVTNAAFKSYLFDKGTLNSIKRNNPYVDVTTKNGIYALGKHAVRNKALGTLATNIWGGFHSNYLDDVTVGYAKSFGIQDYNNYLLQKYNPAAYGATLDGYVNPIIAGMSGAVNSMLDGRSFFDGGIGALGSGITIAPNIGGMASHSEMMKQAAKAAEKNGGKGLSGIEKFSHFVSNPIIQAVADAKAASRMTEAEINRINNIIKDNKYALENITETAATLNRKEMLREGTSVLEAEDAKDMEAFMLAQNLLTMKNSGVVQNAQAEPDKSQWSKKKKIGYTINKAINSVLGTNVFEEAGSPYTRAMQQLEDAAALKEGAADEAQLERQKTLIDTFLGLEINKNAIKDMSESEKTTFAIERLQKNAEGLLNMIDRTEKLQRKFEQSVNANAHPDVARQLMYQYALDERWKERLNELEEQITGEENHTEYTDNNVVAKYGSREGYERALNAQDKRVEQAQKEYDDAKLRTKTGYNPKNSFMENVILKRMRNFVADSAKKKLKKEKNVLKAMEAEGRMWNEGTDAETPVIKAEQILRLNADDRLRMLDDFYRNDYSTEQQREIDKAKNMLVQDGTPLNEAMAKVRDAAILNHRIEDNMEAAKTIMNNPYEATLMQRALNENRKRKVIDYFNDKIISEAFRDFLVDIESTLSTERAAEKAKNYSSAVLDGMLRMIDKEYNKNRTNGELSDKTLATIEGGVKQVLNERNGRMKDTVDFDSFIKKTGKIKHTETTTSPAVDPEIGSLIPIEEQTTTDRELSKNDKKLLEYAIDYAVEKGLSLEELPNAVADEAFDNYVQEKDHGYKLAGTRTGGITESQVGIPENRTAPVSKEYMRSLVEDTLDAFNKHKENTKKVNEAKVVSEKAGSIATDPVEPKGKVKGDTREAERTPNEVNVNDPFNLNGKKEGEAKPTTEATPAPSAQPGVNESENNRQIMNDAAVLNGNILDDVAILLNELDKMDMDDRTRSKLKEIMAAHLNSSSFSSIKELQNRIMEESMITSSAEAPMIANKGANLAGINIEAIKEKTSEKPKQEQQKKDEGNNGHEENGNEESMFPEIPSALETVDLDVLMNYPVWKSFIEQHNIIAFLQKLSDLWNRNDTDGGDKTKRMLKRSHFVFVYDPALAQQVKEDIENQSQEGKRFYNPEVSAPIVLAIEITDENKSLVEDEKQLITIKDKTDNKHPEKKYQPIGVMPSSIQGEGASESLKSTAMAMTEIRKRIDANSSETHVLRYAPARNTGKYNGSPMYVTLQKVNSHTDEESIPHAKADTPRKGVQQLMDENINSDAERLVNATDEEKHVYDDAKKEGLPEVRKTNIYKRMKKAFIDRLFNKGRKDGGRDMYFRVQKGTASTYEKIVLTKKISETADKNTGRPIVDVLKDTDSMGSNAREVIESNSRFKRLFNKLHGLAKPKELLENKDGAEGSELYEKTLREFEDTIENIISNNLNIDELAVRINVEDTGVFGKMLRIQVWSGNINDSANLLSTLSTSLKGKVSQQEFALFLKDLILDKEGNTRKGIQNDNFERVKWQVNYSDLDVINDDKKTPEQKKQAIDNFNDLYDDGVFEMQVTKLAYPARSVSVGFDKMRSKLFTDSKGEPERTNDVTEQKAQFEAESVSGKVDGDSGMHTESPTKEQIKSSLPQRIMDKIARMVADGASRTVTDDEKHYNILGELWSRVTSIKYAMEGMHGRFNENNAWGLPATLIGNSVDEFGRDVFNEGFDNMTEEQLMQELENYDNSTVENYKEVLMSLKAFEARIAGEKGQVVVVTGDKSNPGKITAKGVLDVAIRKGNRIENRKVRVAGTIDVLTVDAEGNFYLYDFKTHRGEFGVRQAIEKGYDRQLSMYAKFLEEEYGIKIKGINIIPVKVKYPIPSGENNDGKPIMNAEKTYRRSRPGSNQLESKDVMADDSKYEVYNDANYKVGQEFELTRLSDAQLTASYDKMTDAEKSAIVEAIKEQTENPAMEVELKTEDVTSAKPDVADMTESSNETRENVLDFDDLLSFMGDEIQSEVTTPTLEDTLNAISPEDSRSLTERMKDHEEGCGK